MFKVKDGTELKIGVKTYTVEYMNNEGENEAVGLYLPMKNKILISEDLDDTTKMLVFLHELMHAFLAHSGLHIDTSLEETIVEGLAHRVAEFLQQNKLIIKRSKR
jgi:Zn-dependent peptidase ImmA (M78 family)